MVRWVITDGNKITTIKELVVIQTKPQDVDIESRLYTKLTRPVDSRESHYPLEICDSAQILTLRHQFPIRHPLTTIHPPFYNNNDNLTLLRKCHDLESHIAHLKRKLVVTELGE